MCTIFPGKKNQTGLQITKNNGEKKFILLVDGFRLESGFRLNNEIPVWYK